MRKKSEIDILLEQELQKQKAEERATRLIANYMLAEHNKKDYFQGACRGAIWGAVIGVLLLLGLSYGAGIKDWGILSILTLIATVSWVFAGFIPAAENIEFPGLITGIMGFTIIFVFSVFLLPLMLLYHILKTTITHALLIKDYKKHPEYYTENPLL